MGGNLYFDCEENPSRAPGNDLFGFAFEMRP